MYPPDTTAASLVPSADEVIDDQPRVASDVLCIIAEVIEKTLLENMKLPFPSIIFTYRT